MDQLTVRTSGLLGLFMKLLNDNLISGFYCVHNYWEGFGKCGQFTCVVIVVSYYK